MKGLSINSNIAGQGIVRILLIALLMVLARVSPAACNLQITSAGPGLANGSYGTPHVGDDLYYLNVSFTAIGEPSGPFRVKFTIANVTYYSGYVTLHSGWYWNMVFDWTIPLDDSMPWSITLDPDGVSGNTNLSGSISNGIVTPTPPASPVEFYSPRMMHGTQTLSVNLQPNSGNVPTVYVIFGQPTTHGAQKAIKVSGSPTGQTIVTPPYGDPILEIARTNVTAGSYQTTNSFVMQLSRTRVNPGLLRTNTWAAMGAMTTNWTQWIAADSTCESTDPAIVNFVQQSLPANYQTTLTPYDTARTLHRAVMKKLTYQSPPLHGDAVGVFQDGVADCQGFAALLTACLRNVGIPARCIAGFFQGDSATNSSSVMHVRAEFHLPGVEWLVADPTFGNSCDPTGSYGYYFGYVPNADSFIAMAAGSVHTAPFATFGELQGPGLWFLGAGASFTESSISYMQPNGVLTMTNASRGMIQFNLNDTPTEGTIVIERSTNLITWSPVVTNSATGSNLNYNFSTSNAPATFYRAAAVP